MRVDGVAQVDAGSRGSFRRERCKLTVRPATPSEVDDVRSVLQESARWLLSRGIAQWRPEWFKHEWVEGQVARGTFHVGSVSSVVVCTMRLEWRDDEVWPDAVNRAGYVHSFAARRSHAGTGRCMLRWAAETVTARRGRLLRLDCWQESRGLREYYERLGFIHRGDVSLHGDTWVASRYELDLSPPSPLSVQGCRCDRHDAGTRGNPA